MGQPTNEPTRVPVVVTPKPWYMSKTLWANGLVIGSIALHMLSEYVNHQSISPEELSAFVVALGNVGLRMTTTQPLSR